MKGSKTAKKKASVPTWGRRLDCRMYSSPSLAALPRVAYETKLSGTVRNSKVQVSPIGSLPLDGSSSDVPSFQLHPVFGAVSNRVPPGNAMSRFVGFGDKSRDNFKYFFRTQGFEFLFLSQRVQRADFGGSIAPKAPVLKLNRPLTRKPPAAIVSESARVVCAPFAKPQVATLRHSWEK